MSIKRFVVASTLALALSTQVHGQLNIDLDDGPLANNSFVADTFTSGGVTFPRVGEFNNYWVLSNITVNQDLAVSPGSRFGESDFDLQQYSAYLPPNGSNTNYAIGVADSFVPSGETRTTPELSLEAPEQTRFQSIQVANTTWVAHSTTIGDGFNAPFTDSDTFKLHIIGVLDGIETGEVTLDLVTGSQPIDEWTDVSLFQLGNASEIRFALSSNSTSTFGGDTFLNPPAYFAIDNLTFVAVPEPGSISLLFAIGGIALLARRRVVTV